MIRFAETNKWDDPWFRSLSGAHKLIFLYVIDRCNNAGFWELDEAAIVFHTKLDSRHLEGAWKALERGLVMAGGWVWVRTFLRHQRNAELNPDNRAHTQIIQQIREQAGRFKECPDFVSFLTHYQSVLSPIQGPSKGLASPTGIGNSQVKSLPARPNREEAIEYGAQIGMGKADVDAWFDHFEANGWKVSGKAPMKDWQAALRNGNRRKAEFTPAAAKRVEVRL